MEIENKRKNVSRKNSDGTKLFSIFLAPSIPDPKKLKGFFQKIVAIKF